jgi:hypothetical protein
VLAQGDQSREAVGGQRAEELVELGPGRWVADALLVDRVGGAADGEADGVVDQQEEGQPGFPVGEPGRLQRPKERLGQGQGVRPQRVAGLEDAGHPRMVLEHLAQPMGQELELAGPVQGRVQADVDLGQHVVEDQVVEALLVPDMVVERPGDHPQAGGQAAHGEGLDAVVGDDREGLGDHPLTGELVAAVLVVDGRVEPQRRRSSVGGGAGYRRPRPPLVGCRPLPLVHAELLGRRS